MAYEAERDALAQQADDLEEAYVKNAERLVKQLRTRLMLLVGVGLSGQMMAYYYRQMMESIQREADVFEGFFLASTGDTFDKLWDKGIAMGRLVSVATGTPYSAPEPLDKQALRRYIQDEASTAVSVLRGKLVNALSMALLKQETPDQAVRGMAEILLNERTLGSLVSRVSADLLGAADTALSLFVGGLVESFPAVADRLTKEWHWSHVSRVNHDAMDGAIVPFDQPFHVPGWGGVPSALMMRPHDMSAPIGQTANCKCSMTIGVV